MHQPDGFAFITSLATRSNRQLSLKEAACSLYRLLAFFYRLSCFDAVCIFHATYSV
ncbi:MAG: hypothetical protein KA821_14025 [Chitinophagaceae bacterium]|nr:hypothetical protein [Chitinophagaceae bacterium]